jgi:hypothetical protein
MGKQRYFYVTTQEVYGACPIIKESEVVQRAKREQADKHTRTETTKIQLE